MSSLKQLCKLTVIEVNGFFFSCLSTYFRNYTLFDMADAVALRHSPNEEPVPQADEELVSQTSEEPISQTSVYKPQVPVVDNFYPEQYDEATEEYYYEDNIIQSSSSTPVLIQPNISSTPQLVKPVHKTTAILKNGDDTAKTPESVALEKAEEAKEKIKKNQQMLDKLLGLEVGRFNVIGVI